MAEGKKGFILYADIIHTVNQLSDIKAGKLFKHILEYVNDKNPETKDQIINLVFEPIKQQLKRDLQHWDEKKTKRAEAGRLGGLAKASNAKQKLANLAVKESVNVNGNVIVNDNVKESVINKNTHPALIGFRNNVFKEAKDQGINETIAESFFSYWTVIDEHTKLFLYQATEPFGIKNRLKNWKAIEDKNNGTFKKVSPNDFEL